MQVINILNKLILGGKYIVITLYRCEVCNSKTFLNKDDCIKHEEVCKGKIKYEKEIDPNILEHEKKYEEVTEIKSANFIHKLICKKHDGSIDTYKVVERKAKKGDLVCIIHSSGFEPFHELYLEKIFYVTTDEIINEWVQPHVSVGYFALYHNQYIVLEKED